MVSIERNEIVLEQNTVLDERFADREMDVKMWLIQREDVGGDYAIIYNT